MPFPSEIERQLEALADEVRAKLAELAPDRGNAAVVRFTYLLRRPAREEERTRLRERARQVAKQGGKCAGCTVAFSVSPPSPYGGVSRDRLLCAACARESRKPPPFSP